jgi:hypothetical protein
MSRPPLRQRSAALRQRMEQVRSRLPHSMDLAQGDIQRLKSWKFHVRRHPWWAAGAAMGLAYWMVPRRRPRRVRDPAPTLSDGRRSWRAGRWSSRLPGGPRRASASPSSPPESSEGSQPVALSIVGVAGGFLLRTALRLVTSFAAGRARSFVMSRLAGAAPARPPSPPVHRGPSHKPSQPERTYDR